MNKGQTKYHRVLGRQVAVELPEEGLAQVGGEGRRPVTKAFSTCDGTVTHDARTGRDCTGATDAIGGLPV